MPCQVFDMNSIREWLVWMVVDGPVNCDGVLDGVPDLLEHLVGEGTHYLGAEDRGVKDKLILAMHVEALKPAGDRPLGSQGVPEDRVNVRDVLTGNLIVADPHFLGVTEASVQFTEGAKVIRTKPGVGPGACLKGKDSPLKEVNDLGPHVRPTLWCDCFKSEDSAARVQARHAITHPARCLGHGGF
jgi:hypothetical protein